MTKKEAAIAFAGEEKADDTIKKLEEIISVFSTEHDFCSSLQLFLDLRVT